MLIDVIEASDYERFSLVVYGCVMWRQFFGAGGLTKKREKRRGKKKRKICTARSACREPQKGERERVLLKYENNSFV